MDDVIDVPTSSVAFTKISLDFARKLLLSQAQPHSSEDFPTFPTNHLAVPFLFSF
jgi:hypothetical protein